MWPISPTPNMEAALTFGNFMALAVLACSVVGLGWMSRSYNNYFRLLKAKQQADDDDLTDSFRRGR